MDGSVHVHVATNTSQGVKRSTTETSKLYELGCAIGPAQGRSGGCQRAEVGTCRTWVAKDMDTCTEAMAMEGEYASGTTIPRALAESPVDSNRVDRRKPPNPPPSVACTCGTCTTHGALGLHKRCKRSFRCTIYQLPTGVEENGTRATAIE